MAYEGGLPFMKEVKNTLDEQIDTVNKNFPSLIIVDGGQGQGKTTFAVHLADYINAKYNLPPIELKMSDHYQLAQGGKEFKRFYNVCKSRKLPVIIYDEAGDFGRRGSLTSFNFFLNRHFETFRSAKIIHILCLPNFNVLDNHLFDLQVPRVLFNLRDRKNRVNDGSYFAYSLYQMNWVRYWFEKLPKATRYSCYLKAYPNYRGHFHNLPEWREKLLAHLSDKGKDKQNELAEIKMDNLKDYQEIANEFGLSVIYIRMLVSKLKLKGKLIGKKKFYDQNEIEKVRKKLEKRPK